MERYNKDKRNSEREKAPEGVVAGRNAVMEQLKAGTPIDKVFVASGEREGSIKLICALVLEKGIPLLECDKNKLDRLAGGSWHQGVVAMVAEKEYCTLDDLFAIAASKGEAPFFVIGDGITDPHNLGALIRCAEGAGAHGVILSKRHCAGLTSVAAKASAGALAHMAVAKVSNIAATIDLLKEKGVWVYAAEAGGSSLYKTDLKGSAAFVFGSEGEGVSRLVKEKCDFIVSIEMYGQVNSFNVSCASAVVLCEAARQRHN